MTLVPTEICNDTLNSALYLS